MLLAILLWFLIPADYAIKNAPPAGHLIVCFGDSLTYGAGSEPNMDYPNQLSKRMGIDIINAGRSGDTSASALKRINEVLELQPDIVLITLGGNDLKNGISKAIAFEHLEQIILQLQGQGAMVVLGGIDIPLFSRGFDKAYEELAEKTGSILVPNVLNGIIGHSELMSDTIHPNSAGYRIMADHFYQALIPYL